MVLRTETMLEVTVPAASVMTVTATSVVLVLGIALRAVLSVLYLGRSGSPA